MAQNNLIITANQIKAKTFIHANTNLNQQYSKGKRPLKMKDSGRDQQLIQPKNGTQTYDRPNSRLLTDKLKVSEKTIEKAKKDKKRACHRRHDN